MKNKIAIGQCYEKDDVIYEVIEQCKAIKKVYFLREIISKAIYTFELDELSKMRRPFNTEG